jgi:hypothetical protein
MSETEQAFHMGEVLAQLATERQRQLALGYDIAHDDEAGLGHLMREAHYRLGHMGEVSSSELVRHELKKIGAIVVAAIEYIDRERSAEELTITPSANRHGEPVPADEDWQDPAPWQGDDGTRAANPAYSEGLESSRSWTYRPRTQAEYTLEQAAENTTKAMSETLLDEGGWITAEVAEHIACGAPGTPHSEAAFHEEGHIVARKIRIRFPESD